jgi:cytoskeletal protein CcmA (bactofilin family)
MKGSVRFTDAVRIAGNFEGTIEANKFMVIEAGAVVKARIQAQDMVVAGEIQGDVEAEGMVELLPGARVTGNIRSARIRVCDGVMFDGRCEMIRNAASLDIFSAPIRELRKVIHLAEDEQ